MPHVEDIEGSPRIVYANADLAPWLNDERVNDAFTTIVRAAVAGDITGPTKIRIFSLELEHLCEVVASTVRQKDTP